MSCYELLTLKAAYTGESQDELFRQIAFQEPLAPRRLNPSIPTDLETILQTAISKDPDERYQSARELADELNRYLNDEPIRARRPGIVGWAVKWSRRHKSLVWSGFGAVLVSFLGLILSVLLIASSREKAVDALAKAEKAEKEAQANATLAEDKASELRRQARIADEARRDAEANRQVAVNAMKRVNKELYMSDMSLAEMSFQNGNLGGLTRAIFRYLPAEGTPDYRDFEWYHWWYAANRHLRFVRSPGGEPFGRVCVSPNGSLFAAHYANDKVMVYDADTHRLHRLLSYSVSDAKNSARDLRFSPDGNELVEVGPDNGIRRWDTTHWNLRPLLTSDPNSPLAPLSNAVEFTSLAFARGYPLVAIGTASGEIQIRHAETWEVHHHLEGGAPVVGLSFTPDGKTLVSAHTQADFVDGSEPAAETNPQKACLVAWRTDDWTPRNEVHKERCSVLALALSPADSTIAWSTKDGGIQISHAESLKEICRLSSPIIAHSVEFSMEGRFLAATNSRDNSVHVWRTDTWDRISAVKGHEKPVNAAFFAGKKERLWSASEDGMLKEWSVQDCEPSIRVPLGLPENGRTVKLNLQADCEALLSFAMHVDGGAPIQRWDFESGQLLSDWRGGEKYLDAGISDNGRFLAACTRDSKVHLWEIENGREIMSIDAEDIVAGDMAVSQNGRTIAWLDSSNQAVVFDVETGEKTRLPCGWYRLQLALNGDGNRLIASYAGAVDVWDLTSIPPEQIRIVDLHTMHVALSPDGNLIALGTWDNLVRIVDTNTGDEVGELAGHSDTVNWVEFAPGGNRLVSTSGRVF